MNLHLLYDKKFAKGQIEVFEQYFPGQSLYVITKGSDIIDLEKYNVMLLNNMTQKSLKSIQERCGNKIENIFVYNAGYDVQCIVALNIRKKCGSKIYWMFFGSDLYTNLYYRYNYPLIDDERKTLKNYLIDKMRMIKHWPLFKHFAAKVDYFCFWNIYDYQLLTKYVKTQAKFKFYTHDGGIAVNNNFVDYKKGNTGCVVQINHSASWDGNHLTVLKKIARIDNDRRLKLLIPLSYGKQSVVKEVENFIEKERLNAEVLKAFLPIDEYYALTRKVNATIFGQHRQEGGYNIIQSFRSGTKVFLREDNNLLRLYRDWGLKVFSFEDDLNSIEDLLTPLPIEDQILNNCRIQECMSQEKVSESMRHFFD